MRGIEEGYAGVESNDLPNTFVITVDGAEVHSAQIGGLEDHKVQAKDMNEARAILDARMTARVTVTAGPHDIGFTFRERPSQPPGRLAAGGARQPGDPLHRRPAEAARPSASKGPTT